MATISDFLRQKIAETLSLPVEDINSDDEFMDLGLDSMHAIFLIEEIEKEYKVEINPHHFWEYPTINLFAANLQSQLYTKS